MGADIMKICHGGDIYSENVKYDFSANINPLGIPFSVKKELTDRINEFSNYPDVNCTALKNAIAEHENVNAEKIVCGNGAADLIYRIVQALKPKKSLLLAPSFSEYEKALLSVDSEIEYFFLDEKNDFKLNDKIFEKIHDIDFIFICNPNNPSGNIISSEMMRKIINKCSQNNIYLVIDECFMDFVSDNEKYAVKTFENNVIILKAFTKIYAMAGLRLGYLICSDENLTELIENCGQCWSVSVPAQIAGIAALKEKEYVKKTINLISEERRYLTEKLTDLGFKVYSSYANFILFRCNIPLDKILINEGISIRNCNNYHGLDERYFRIAVRTHAENEILTNSIERVIKSG